MTYAEGLRPPAAGVRHLDHDQVFQGRSYADSKHQLYPGCEKGLQLSSFYRQRWGYYQRIALTFQNCNDAGSTHDPALAVIESLD